MTENRPPGSSPEPVSEPPEAVADFQALGFFPADYAAVESGKIYASGAFFSTMRFPVFPAVVPHFALVAVIETPFHTHQADHRLEVEMFDFDHKPAGLKIHATFRTAPTLEIKYGQSGVFPAAFPVGGLVFPRSGQYSFGLSIDGKQLATYPLTVIQLGAPVEMQLPFPPPSVAE